MGQSVTLTGFPQAQRSSVTDSRSRNVRLWARTNSPQEAAQPPSASLGWPHFCSQNTLETGTHSPWVSRLLNELGHEAIVAHARNVRLIGESCKKDDRLDSRTLARLARIDPELPCPVKHRSATAQADLSLIPARAGLVRARTALVNTAHGLAKSNGERLRRCNVRNMKSGERARPESGTATGPAAVAGGDRVVE
jgi:hypothetical protein